MVPKLSKEVKDLSFAQSIPTILRTQRTYNNIDEERDSPNEIITFTNKKIQFKSKFDKKGSDEFLSSKDIALCDVILDDEIEEENENEYNDISFMQKFTFSKVNNLVKDEKKQCKKHKNVNK